MPAEPLSHRNPGDDSRIPRPFGRMWLLRRLARGGMGEVYLAGAGTIDGAERPCVVKIIRRDHANDRSFLARFLDEARVQAQLHHPGVAQVLEAAVDPGGEPYVVVEYVEGRSLGEVRARAARVGYRLTWADAVAIGAALAEALAHTHERTDAAGRALGIVHRDLSPQNVMLGYGGDVKLIDFGTARAENRRCRTISGVVYAKPGYVAPEIANGRPGDFRVDLYALGIMVWELLAGRRFLTGDPAEHMAAVAKGELTPPPIAASVGAPAELDQVLAKLFAYDADARYASSSKAVGDITKILSRAPSLPNGERGVRARIALLLSNLYPAEPSRSRAEFLQLMRIARAEQRLQVSKPADKESLDPPRVLADPFPSKKSQPAPLPSDPNRFPGTPYQIVREIGRGAMGVVYEAVHVELLRRVALKVLPSEQSVSGSAAEAFRREARSVARLCHPNLVTIHEFGRATDGRLYCAMELVRGETLEQRVRRIGALDWEEVVAIGIDACRGLEAAHRAGILHRDLTPSNLLVCEPEALLGARREGRALVKLVDFGIAEIRSETRGQGAPAEASGRERGGARVGTCASAKAVDGNEAAIAAHARGVAEPLRAAESDSDLEVDVFDDGGEISDVGDQPYDAELLTGDTEQKASSGPTENGPTAAAARECVKIVGTPEYMAPEQAGGGTVDARADLYALASVLYEACTGRLPYESGSLVGLIESKLAGRCPPMRPPGMHRPVPKAFDRVIARALAPEPAHRYETATALREALEGVWTSQRHSGRRSWRGRGRLVGALATIGAAVALTGAGILVIRSVAPHESSVLGAGSADERGAASWIRSILRRDSRAGQGSADPRPIGPMPVATAASPAIVGAGATTDPTPATSVTPTAGARPGLAAQHRSFADPPASRLSGVNSVVLHTSESVLGGPPPASSQGSAQGEPLAPTVTPKPGPSEPIRGRDRPHRGASVRVAVVRGGLSVRAAHQDGATAVPAPDLAPYASMLADALSKLSDGEFGRALELFRILAAAYPADLSALRGWVEAAMANRDWAEAQRAAERWQLVDAGTAPRLYLARVQTYAGHEADAVTTLRALLESHPECDEARAMLRDHGASFPRSSGEGTRAARTGILSAEPIR